MESLKRTYEEFVEAWKEDFQHISLGLIEKVTRTMVTSGYKSRPILSLTIQYQHGTDLKKKLSELEKDGIPIKSYGQEKVDDVTPEKGGIIAWFSKVVTGEITVNEELLEKFRKDKDIRYVDIASYGQ